MAKIYQPFFIASTLHKILDKIWFSTTLCWISEKSKWEFVEIKKTTYLISTVGLKTLFLAISAWALLIRQRSPDLCTFPHSLCIFILIVVCVLMIALDGLICFEGREVLIGLNWCYQKGDWILQYGSKSTIKISATLFAVSELTVVLIGIVAAFAVAKSGLDPFVVVFRYHGLQDTYNILDWFRYIFMIYGSQVAIICCRQIVVTLVIEDFLRILLLKILSESSPTLSNINLYRENFIVMQTMLRIETQINTEALVTIFVSMILGVNAFILGYTRGVILLSFISGMLVILIGMLMHLVFYIGCSFFQLSSKTLTSWRSDISNKSCSRVDRKHLTRMISSLQTTRCPAGSVGIVDREIKVNYLEKLLDYIVDSIIVNPQLLGR